MSILPVKTTHTPKMPEPLSNQFQPMTVKEILQRAMHLYRADFLKLVSVAAPGTMISALAFQAIWVYRYAAMKGPEVLEAALLYIPLIAFQSLIVTAAGLILVSERFLGRSISVGTAYTKAARSILPLLGAAILFTVAVTVGLTVFVLGIVAYAWFCLIPSVVVLEGEGGAGALKRSRVIVKGNFNKAFLVVVLFTIVQAVATTLLLWLPSLVANFSVFPSLFSLLSICLTLLIEPFKVASTTLLYYDLRIRKEGYSLQLLSEEIAALS